jgi:hypothetical protein
VRVPVGFAPDGQGYMYEILPAGIWSGQVPKTRQIGHGHPILPVGTYRIPEAQGF